MPIAEITWQCGHIERIRIRAQTQDYWTRRAEHEDCPDCRHELENAKAAEAAKAEGLPELIGTPKQVGWAETLRQTLLAQVGELEVKIPATDPNLPRWRELVARLQRANKASWWIDQRGKTPLDIFRRWEAERREAERTTPVRELLGEIRPPASTVAARQVGFQAPAPPEAEPLRPAAQTEYKPPVAGYDPNNERRLIIEEVSDV